MSHAYQTWNNCGPVAALMALSYYGIAVSQPQAADALKTHPQDKSVSPGELVTYMTSLGLEARVLINGRLEVVKRLLSQGIPVILSHRLSLQEDYGHYTVARGYDDARGVIIINDSYFGPMRGAAYSEMEALWQHSNRRYIPVYRPEDRAKVETILGPDASKLIMLRRALTANQVRINDTPNSAIAWLNLGETHFLLGDDATAIAAWEKAQTLGLSPRVLWYSSWPATAYNRLGLPENVLALTQRVIVEQPASPDLYYERGLAYLALGDRVRARQALNQTLVYDPGMERARRALAELGAS